LANKVQPLFGEVLKTFGTEGELLIKLSETALKDEKIKEPLFIMFDGLWVPFFIKLIEYRGRKSKIIFENMESEELAEELLGKKIFYHETDETTSAESEFSDLIGFVVKDKNLGEIGVVTEIFDIPGNPCLGVKTPKSEVMIPLNGKLKAEPLKNTIITEIPEGLLDLF